MIVKEFEDIYFYLPRNLTNRAVTISILSFDDFVSDRALNHMTFGFDFPIYCYADSIDDLSDSCGSLLMISLDVLSGYHQFRVRESD